MKNSTKARDPFFIRGFLFLLISTQIVVGQNGVLVKDIYPLSGDAGITQMSSIGDKVVFRANNGTNGTELWISDGTEAGTVILKDINIGDQFKSSFPSNFRKYKDFVTFEANDGGQNAKLFRTNGTERGTFQIWDRRYNETSYNGLTEYSLPVFISTKIPCEIIVDSTIYWLVGDINGTSLIIKDFNNDKVKTVLDRNITTDIVRFGGPFLPQYLDAKSYVVRFGDKWLFNAEDRNGYGLYVSDGTTRGTVKLLSMEEKIAIIVAETPTGLLAFFAFNGGGNGRELWKTDGTVNGTKMVKNIAPGSRSSIDYQDNLIQGQNIQGYSVKNGIVFKANDVANGRELWFSDGTESGTQMIKEFVAGSESGLDKFYMLDLSNDNKPFLYNPSANELWRTDGTTNGTKFVTNINLQFNSSFFRSGNYLYYLNRFDNKTTKTDIVRIDTQTGIATIVGQITNNQDNFQFAVAGDFLYYYGFDTKNGGELWKFAVPKCSHTAKIVTLSGTSFCTGGSVNITGEAIGTTNPYTFKWKQGINEISTATSLMVSKAGNYILEVTDKNGCVASTSVNITQDSNLPVSITGSNIFCSGQSTTLTANVAGGISPFNFQWKNNTINVGTNSNTFNATTAGNYSVSVTDSKGCTGISSNIVVTQKPSPLATIMASSLAFITGGSVTLNANIGTNLTYQWIRNSQPITNAVQAVYTAQQIGEYKVVVGQNDCFTTSNPVTISLITATNSPLPTEGIKIYPNPSNGVFVVELNEATFQKQGAAAAIEVVDATGKSIWQRTIPSFSGKHSENIDISTSAAGTYFLRVVEAEKVSTQKVVKGN